MVHLAVDSCAWSISAVPYEHEMLCSLFTIRHCCAHASGQDIGYFLAIGHRIEQGSTHPNFFKESLYAFHVAPKRFHFHSVNDVTALYDNVCIAFGPQAQKCFERRVFPDTALLEAADDNARCVGFGKGKFRKRFLRFPVQGIDGEGTCVVVCRTEMYHQQGCFLATLQIGKQVARNKTALSVCATEEGGLT